MQVNHRPERRIVLENTSGMRLILSDFGAAWLSCSLIVAGKRREVILCSAEPLASLGNGAYLGATIGRYAGRIAGGKYCDRQREYHLSVNEGLNCLHGGKNNFARKYWTVVAQARDRVVFELFSRDGEQGFPGNVTARAGYFLDPENNVILDWSAQTDAETVVNLTNHAYFNLDGDSPETRSDALGQKLWIDAEYFVPIARDGIPVAPAQVVRGGMDFRAGKSLAADFLRDEQQQIVSGYDHSFLLEQHGDGTSQARLDAAAGDLGMEVHTTQRALHLYSGQFLCGTPNRHGGHYRNCAGIALETQAPPDSPNQRYHLVRLTPETPYQHQTRYCFRTA